jgi:hypothetical protein
MAETLATGRRGFMFGAGAVLFADPKLLRSRIPVIHGDGVHDDWEGLQSLILGKPVKTATGDTFAPGDRPSITGGDYLISRTLEVPNGRVFGMSHARITGSTNFKGYTLLQLNGNAGGLLSDLVLDARTLPWAVLAKVEWVISHG